MLAVTNDLSRAFTAPRSFVALEADRRSVQILELMADRVEAAGGECYRVADVYALDKLYENGCSPSTTVLLYDQELGGKRRRRRKSFTYRSRMRNDVPPQACGAQWAVAIGEPCNPGTPRAMDCANQICSSFLRRFDSQLDRGYFPWGPVREHEARPARLELPSNIDELVQQLNSGPDLAASIASTAHAAELPSGSKISWQRVPPDPFQCRTDQLVALSDLMGRFEKACHSLVRTDDTTHEELLAGVRLVDPRMRDAYLFPQQASLSARRLDLHFRGETPFASENDEMPGGFAEACFLDWKYDVNQDRWRQCFAWLCRAGKLVFVVSHTRCACYLSETEWLVAHLKMLGHDSEIVTTDAMDKLTVSATGVQLRGDPVATIWRLFPTYETQGKLADIVLASQAGLVRLVPEFGHYCAKAWFALFRTRREFFEKALGSADCSELDQLLPDTRLVRWSGNDFPCRVGGIDIPDLDELRKMSCDDRRNHLVLKICGDNLEASRSYGVLMGRNLEPMLWCEWIEKQANRQQSFVIQEFRVTDVTTVPVLNTTRGGEEAFRCRLLFRPWAVNGHVTTGPVFAIPSSSFSGHGRVDMGLAPVDLG